MIGENISKIRKQKKLTLSELAQRANVSKSYLSNLERSLNQNPSIQIVENIASVLGVDLRTLLVGDVEERPIPDNEWLDFVDELRNSGVEKNQLSEYKTVIEFVKWRNEKHNWNKGG